MKKRKQHPTDLRNLQLEIGRLQQENQDLRRENQRLAQLVAALDNHLREQPRE